MGEIPGTRISSPAWSQQAQWEATSTYQDYLALGCPEGSGRAIAVDVAVMVWSNYCVKTWRSQAVIQAWEKYYSDEAEGRANAYEQSLAWNKANPGKQKCFSYGPLTSPDGGTTSGGVCANPVTTTKSINGGPSGIAQNPTSESTQSQLPSQDGVENSQFPGGQDGSTSEGSEASEILGNDGSFPTITVRLLASLPRG